MNCSNCNNPIPEFPEALTLCPYCGASLEQQNAAPAAEPAPAPANEPVYESKTVPLVAPAAEPAPQPAANPGAFTPFVGSEPFQAQQPASAYPQQPVSPYPQQSDDPYMGQSMKWYKFLVYFGLWAGALISLVNGFRTMTGLQYGSASDDVYSLMPAMKGIDILVGLLMLGSAAFSVYTALRLLHLRKDSPKLLTYVYVINLAVTLLYLILAASAAADYLDISDLIDASTISSALTSVAMIFVNRSYFQKRAAIFNR